VSSKARCVAASGAALAALAVGAACAFGGCTNTVTALVYTPITGIVIRSADLVAGHGCGTAPGQVYAYSAVLAQPLAPDVAIASTVVYCYSDGVLSNLDYYDAGADQPNNVYDITIYAYEYGSFPADLACSPPISNGACPGDSPDATIAATRSVDGGILPRWTTTCVASQIPGEPSLAECKPLEPTTIPAEASAGD
jgi:hypothetical protein